MSLNLIYRDTKGSPLTAAEGDANMRTINAAVSALQAAAGTTALVDQPTTTWDYSAGNVATWTAIGSRTLQITNLPSGVCSGLLVFVQGNGGGYTPTLGGLTSATFAIAQAANAVTFLDFTKIGNVLYWNSTPFGTVAGGTGSAPVLTSPAQAANVAQSYLTRIANRNVVLPQAFKDAYTTLISDIQPDGTYDGLYELWPFLGASAVTHAFGAKGSKDLIFVGNWVHSATGSKADGVAAYARTSVYPAAQLTNNSTSLGYYSRTQTQASGDVLGSTDGTDATNRAMRMVIKDQNSDRLFTEIGSAQQRIDLGSGGANSLGLFVSSRTSSTVINAYRNDSNIGGFAGANSGSLPSAELYLNALNKAGTANNFAENECAFAFVGNGLTDSQVTTLYNAVQKFQMAIGRNV